MRCRATFPFVALSSATEPPHERHASALPSPVPRRDVASAAARAPLGAISSAFPRSPTRPASTLRSFPTPGIMQDQFWATSTKSWNAASFSGRSVAGDISTANDADPDEFHDSTRAGPSSATMSGLCRSIRAPCRARRSKPGSRNGIWSTSRPPKATVTTSTPTMPRMSPIIVPGTTSTSNPRSSIRRENGLIRRKPRGGRGNTRTRNSATRSASNSTPKT